MTPTVRRCRGDGGQIGGVEVLPFSVLLFVGATLLLVNVWGVIDAKFAVTAAAREATRAYVEADSEAEASLASAHRAAETLTAYGRGGERSTVGTPVLERAFGRCVRVSVAVHYRVPAIRIPYLGGFGSAISVASTHSEIVDPFRDGLAGEAAC